MNPLLSIIVLVVILTCSHDWNGHLVSAFRSPYQTAWTNHLSTSSLLNQTWIDHQYSQSLHYLLQNVNPSGTKRGFIAASPSKINPNYFYMWTRDASLVTLVLTTIQQDMITDILYDYVAFQVHTQQIVDETPCQCLGEPKFNADGSIFSGEWGRPQNDGPAERAITMIKFTSLLHSKEEEYIHSTLKPAIYLDLDYVVKTWEEPCFDLWEEINGIHFYTLMAMRRGLLDGSIFALEQGDKDRSHIYRHTARKIQQRLDSFWSSSDNYIRVTQNQVKGRPKPSGLDTSTLLAANLAAPLGDGFFTPGSDKVLATAKILQDTFAQLYPLNKDGLDQIAMGRYPEDIYDGYGISQGNPWFLATTAMTELFYNAMQEWKHKGGVEVNEINYDFFKQHDPAVALGHMYRVDQPDFNSLLTTLAYEADQFLVTLQHHQQANGSLSEQFNRHTGYQQGALDLTWSYSALISALSARSQFFT